MEFKKLLKEIQLKPIYNKANGQINFSLKKGSFNKDIKDKLHKLKSIKLKPEDFEFY